MKSELYRMTKRLIESNNSSVSQTLMIINQDQIYTYEKKKNLFVLKFLLINYLIKLLHVIMSFVWSIT